MKPTYLILILIVLLNSCKKLVEVPSPVTSTTGLSVYTNDATAIAVMTGLYTQLSSAGSSFNAGTISSLSLYAGLSADEFTLLNTVSNVQQISYYTNNLSANAGGTGYGPEFWSACYPYIYTCNSVLAGLNTSGSLTPAVRQQLLGEAEFMRAFFYFYLVNLYGDVPMPLGTDYHTNGILGRTPAALVYQQMIADLKDAESKLSANFPDATLLNTGVDRVRPSKWAAAALLARVYLYQGDWADAETQSGLLIGNTAQFSLSPLSSVFLAAGSGNSEAILQLQPVSNTPTQNTPDGYYFILTPNGFSTFNPVSLSNSLVNSFESGDQRMTNWVGTLDVSGTIYYFPYKYKINTPAASPSEYEMLLRLGEQYLIRAEARAELGEAAAVADLDAIRERAGLPDYTGPGDKASLLTAIAHERRIELFSELGHRWLDLKRTQTVNSVMGSPGNTCQLKGGSWSSNWQLYPVPVGDIQADAHIKQNAGY